MKNKLLVILILGILVFGITGCGGKTTNDNLTDDNNNDNIIYESNDELNEVNNKIIEYFTLNGVDDYENFSYNYVDEKNGVVVVGLLDNSSEEQEKFKRLVVDSDLIKFKKAEKINLNDR